MPVYIQPVICFVVLLRSLIPDTLSVGPYVSLGRVSIFTTLYLLWYPLICPHHFLPLDGPAFSQMLGHLFHLSCGLSRAHPPYVVFCPNRINTDSVPCVCKFIISLSRFLSLPYLVPSPPTFFTKAINTTAVQVLWELPSKPGKTEGFRLTYRRVPSGLMQGPIELPCHVNAHTISHLGECKFVLACDI